MNPRSEHSWYKTAVIYQLHVKAFCDSDGDGMGDFRGLISKLDYLADLGVTALWLLPFYPSPLRDDGYDTADYMAVNPSYGTLDDFKEFLAAAHARGLKVITELVMNHTSDQHPWFQRARKSPPGSDYRNYYVWSDTPNRYTEARIIFKDFEHSNWTWDPVANAYFWHRFYSHQPDLNFDNPVVQEAMFEVLDFWFKLGVDGLRLDAVPYLFEREGTNCENLPETHAFLKRLRTYIDANYQDRMLLAEANQWPEDAVAYFGQGDECHMAFHFPVMPRMFMALQMEDRFPMIDILDQTPAIAEGCQWAMFLRNHDELTLEMVTDEERDYMYRVYAADLRARINLGIRRRLAPLLGNSRRKIELLHMLLLSLPGTPIIYYGDEIGMGDNFYLGDRNGVRTPMQWSADRNAGFSRANPQQLFLPIIIDPEYHYEAINVEIQEKNLSSLLWWTRRLIEMRRRFVAFGCGSIEFLLPDNGKVLAFLRRHESETILVLANLSRFAQPVELDLSPYAGLIPREVFSQNAFPVIKTSPYFFTLAPHDHIWLSLEPSAVAVAETEEGAPLLDIEPKWNTLLQEPYKEFLEDRVLPGWMMKSRWFSGKANKLRSVTIRDWIPLGIDDEAARLLFVDTTYLDAPAQTYLLPLHISGGEEARRLLKDFPRLVLTRLGGDTVLHDAFEDERFRSDLLTLIAKEGHVGRGATLLKGHAGAALSGLVDIKTPVPSRPLSVEQSNSSIVYDNKLFLKLYRKVEEGINPDAELIRHLSEVRHFASVPAYCGSLEYQVPRSEARSIGLLVASVPNEGDAWKHALDSVGRYFDRVLESKPPKIESALLEEFIGGAYPDRVRMLAQRTAEMHLALAGDSDDPALAPEPFTGLYQRSLYQSMRATTRRMTQLAQKRVDSLPEAHRAELSRLPKLEGEILRRQAKVLKKIDTLRIRVHGDFHLGQVLNTGKDFIILDFEGEPIRSLGERRMKRSALKDVAGMIRSFHYAAYSGLWQQSSQRGDDATFLEPWAEAWSRVISQLYLKSYLLAVGNAPFLPADEESIKVLLEAHLLEKAAYEVDYELSHRPDWAILPARGIRGILEASEG